MNLEALKISPKKIEVLHQMNLYTTHDLLTHYPYRYEIMEEKERSTWQKDDRVVLEAVIISAARVIRLRGKQSMTRFKVLYQEEEFQATIFNRPWTSAFQVGKKMTFVAKYDGKQGLSILSCNAQPLAEQLGYQPVYSLKEGISQKDFQKYVQKALMNSSDAVDEWIPYHYREKYRLVSKKEALYGIHLPKSRHDLSQSLRYLKYEEFLRFQLSMQAMKKSGQVVSHGNGKSFDMEEIEALQKSLPFELTKDQQQTIDDILKDLKSEKVMYRMVQGDVGCGKTMVAAFAMYACVLAHKQAALLVPTEILARQHVKNLQNLFEGFNIEVALLCSSMKQSEKDFILKRLANHEIDIIIGTHALFQSQVQFYDLGLVVADEQHRFGVEQRKKMLSKGEKVDLLLMSATPIPRTLAISLYGDMDVSTIASLPSNRKGVESKYIASKSMGPILPFVLQKVDEGNQCYVVCPAIEKNEEYVMRNVVDIYQGMQSLLGQKYNIALLHGKMHQEEKEAIMNDFVAGKIHFLISTTVIEVGVDVKNANIMVIYDAHRFGMSQIHQLRGRVGRGDQKGYCFLLSDSNDEDSIKRLELCASTSDGFQISQYDLQLRGPGDLLGTRQSGVPGFLLGDIVSDGNILEVARKDAQEILANIHDIAYLHIKKDLDMLLSQGTFID